MISYSARVVTAGVLTIAMIGLLCALNTYQTALPTVSAAEAPQKKELPPLVVDTDSPLLLDEADDKQAGSSKISASVAENTACYVCHENYSEEPLAGWHASEGVGCVDCHGKSYDHRNDENNTTPPDVMFPLDKIDESCQECHDSHDVPATDVVARLRMRVPRLRDGQRVVCTECHGQHRLEHRTVVWERTTRQLLTGNRESSQQKPGSQLDRLKQLAGAWVRVGPDGEPSDQVVSTFRVTAAGSAVVEVLFPGTEHEIMTVYYLDGDDLLLTHYCAAANQPRMRCVAGDDPDVLVFTFVDATNMRSLDDRHMHAGTIRILGPDHMQSKWQGYEEGKSTELVEFDLVRKK